MKKVLELYLHIPFCARKCKYCDFLSFKGKRDDVSSYVEHLKSEIASYRDFSKDYEVKTIFVGGGTPSVLSGEQMRSLFQTIYHSFEVADDAEITAEVNPGTVTKSKLEAYRAAGINRLSFGLQSTRDEELKLLGRIHTYQDFLESYHLARACGFTNINVDLISAIPRQTAEQFFDSLVRIAKLKPEHISVYSLIVEEGTEFYELYGEGAPFEKELPSEEEDREIYHKTEEILNQYGFQRYEISNYALEGKECRHNLGYWERKEYLGLGLGASSLLDNCRYKNISDLSLYIEKTENGQSVQEEKEVLSETDRMEEYLFLGLRKIKGISMREFETSFDKPILDCYGKQIRKLEQMHLLKIEDGRLMLTKKGLDVSNYVFGELLS